MSEYSLFVYKNIFTFFLCLRYQDAIAVCQKFHKPDFFITFTCNPLWPEIQQQLSSHQTAASRPDIVVRVFRLKLRSLIDDLRYRGKKELAELMAITKPFSDIRLFRNSQVSCDFRYPWPCCSFHVRC